MNFVDAIGIRECRLLVLQDLKYLIGQFCGITFCPCAQGLISSMSPNGCTCVELQGNK